MDGWPDSPGSASTMIAIWPTCDTSRWTRYSGGEELLAGFLPTWSIESKVGRSCWRSSASIWRSMLRIGDGARVGSLSSVRSVSNFSRQITSSHRPGRIVIRRPSTYSLSPARRRHARPLETSSRDAWGIPTTTRWSRRQPPTSASDRPEKQHAVHGEHDALLIGLDPAIFRLR